MNLKDTSTNIGEFMNLKKNNIIRVKPVKEGLVLRKPPGGIPLKAEGENVPNNSFWRRRLKDGDVVITKEEKPKTSFKKDKE